MPVITIENAGKLSREQKSKIIAEVTRSVSEITGKPADYVYVKISEIPGENFGIGGKTLG